MISQCRQPQAQFRHLIRLREIGAYVSITQSFNAIGLNGTSTTISFPDINAYIYLTTAETAVAAFAIGFVSMLFIVLFLITPAAKIRKPRLRPQPRKHVPRGHQRDLSRIRLVRPISRGRPSSPGCSCTVPPQVVVGGYPERDSCSCNLRDDHDLAHSASPSCVFNGTSNANDFDHYRRDRSDCTDRLQHDLACSQYQEYSW